MTSDTNSLNGLFINNTPVTHSPLLDGLAFPRLCSTRDSDDFQSFSVWQADGQTPRCIDCRLSSFYEHGRHYLKGLLKQVFPHVLHLEYKAYLQLESRAGWAGGAGGGTGSRSFRAAAARRTSAARNRFPGRWPRRRAERPPAAAPGNAGAASDGRCLKISPAGGRARRAQWPAISDRVFEIETVVKLSVFALAYIRIATKMNFVPMESIPLTILQRSLDLGIDDVCPQKGPPEPQRITPDRVLSGPDRAALSI
ncbi:hypothetical protein EVAR_16025_1 [Eumeta japonica]|uniref:Uncharacterized protein n=1 Tax=Eumeta variegata TaxID=151549 RepID=A0A4C1VXA5_EUMVA|nr:hypothetical protein EVAR_16025_1 [Eumeta japonica]